MVHCVSQDPCLKIDSYHVVTSARQYQFRKRIRFKNVLTSHVFPFSGQTVVKHPWTQEEKKSSPESSRAFHNVGCCARKRTMRAMH